MQEPLMIQAEEPQNKIDAAELKQRAKQISDAIISTHYGAITAPFGVIDLPFKPNVLDSHPELTREQFELIVERMYSALISIEDKYWIKFRGREEFDIVTSCRAFKKEYLLGVNHNPDDPAQWKDRVIECLLTHTIVASMIELQSIIPFSNQTILSLSLQVLEETTSVSIIYPMALSFFQTILDNKFLQTVVAEQDSFQATLQNEEPSEAALLMHEELLKSKHLIHIQKKLELRLLMCEKTQSECIMSQLEALLEKFSSLEEYTLEGKIELQRALENQFSNFELASADQLKINIKNILSASNVLLDQVTNQVQVISTAYYKALEFLGPSSLLVNLNEINGSQLIDDLETLLERFASLEIQTKERFAPLTLFETKKRDLKDLLRRHAGEFQSSNPDEWKTKIQSLLAESNAFLGTIEIALSSENIVGIIPIAYPEADAVLTPLFPSLMYKMQDGEYMVSALETVLKEFISLDNKFKRYTMLLSALKTHEAEFRNTLKQYIDKFRDTDADEWKIQIGSLLSGSGFFLDRLKAARVSHAETMYDLESFRSFKPRINMAGLLKKASRFFFGHRIEEYTDSTPDSISISDSEAENNQAENALVLGG